jgi:serine/threonine protein kinase
MDVYEIVKTIGSGAFGQVYLVKHKLAGNSYVIKKVKIKDMPTKEQENTKQEVRLLQKLRHVNIVAYKDSFEDRENQLNIVMIHCEGGDMATKIKDAYGNHLPENQLVDWFAQMCLALFYLHERRILHRDLKPQNIFLKNGRIRLGDFGIAKVLDSTKDFADTLIGTPYFMSPELYKNKPYSYESDIWALGCIFYEMCNLKHAFDAQSINGLALKILKGTYPSINSMYSKTLRDLIDRMLSQKKSQRPTIVDIIKTPVIKSKVIQYMKKCFNGDNGEGKLLKFINL